MVVNLTTPKENKTRFLFLINTAGQAYTWQPVIQDLLNKGFEIKILARDQGHTIKILQSFGLEFSVFNVIGSRATRLLGFLKHLKIIYKLSNDFNPSMIIGFGVDAAILAVRLRKNCVVFIDDDPTLIQNHLAGFLSNAVITPQCFKSNLGKKQIRIEGYKELAYLHPNYFKPDPAIFDELGINRSDKYVIVRFNAFAAVHDIGKRGFSNEDKITAVKQLGKYIRIFISSENNLPYDLEPYRLPIPPHRIHHVLSYAQLFLSDTGTMSTESAILGTPSIICLSNANKFGNFIELENRYGLLYAFNEPEKAIAKALELIQQPDLKEQWAKKREILLADKIDVTKFMVNFIENYPISFKKYKELNKEL
jgi:hypothetical protein